MNHTPEVTRNSETLPHSTVKETKSMKRRKRRTRRSKDTSESDISDETILNTIIEQVCAHVFLCTVFA